MAKSREELLAVVKDREQENRALEREYQRKSGDHNWWATPEANELSTRTWQSRQALMRAVAAVDRHDKKIVAQNPPQFVTWKRYGFRHIVLREGEPRHYEYGGHKYTITGGKAFCGNDFSIHAPDGGDPAWWLENQHDLRGTARPLCGTCRNQWKRITGETLT